MKSIPLLLVLSCAALLAGCDSLGDAMESVRTKLKPREEPRLHVFSAEQRAVYEACVTVAGGMDYHFVEGGPAEGYLKELSEVRGSGSGSRQIALTVRLHPADQGGTQASLSFMEIVEDNPSDLRGNATVSPLEGTALYEDFFRDVERALSAPGKH